MTRLGAKAAFPLTWPNKRPEDVAISCVGADDSQEHDESAFVRPSLWPAHVMKQASEFPMLNIDSSDEETSRGTSGEPHVPNTFRRLCRGVRCLGSAVFNQDDHPPDSGACFP